VTKPIKAGLLGIGSYVPERVLSNADLEKMVDTTDEWITKRTGIKTRRIAAPNETTSDMAVAAARKAIDRAGLKAEQIDLILVATVTPDTPTPAAACWVQAKLGAFNAAASDISAACSGFIYGLSMARAFVESGTYKHILVVGAEKLSCVTDWTDRSTCVLFGDGAGAAVIGPIRGNRGEILSVALAADGKNTELLLIPAGGSRMPASADTVARHLHTIKMQGQEVFKIAVKVMEDIAKESLAMANLPLKKLDWIIPHQANSRIIHALAERLDFPMDRVIMNIDRLGNFSAATVVVALDEAVTNGSIKEGQSVLLVTFGAGTTFAATVLRW
jgi:3-oxoacyl-[acyl-carrier-protein] synthase-3